MTTLPNVLFCFSKLTSSTSYISEEYNLDVELAPQKIRNFTDGNYDTYYILTIFFIYLHFLEWNVKGRL